MQRKKLTLRDDPKKGIHLVAASSPVNPLLLKAGQRTLEKYGWKVFNDPCNTERLRYFAGAQSQRAQRLETALTSTESRFLWCARGGYGMASLLPQLETRAVAREIRKQPKLILGFSDVTALHLWAHRHLEISTLHCPMPATESWQRLTARQRERIFSYLSGKPPLGPDSHMAKWALKPLKPFRRGAKGLMIGGNLSLVVSSLGTSWEPNWKGKILFLEDCAENPYRVDRMLLQLEQSGALKKLSGIVLGDFKADVVYRTKAEKKFWAPMFQERLGHLPYPILMGAPVGHGSRNEPLPLGAAYEITSDGRLLLLEWKWPLGA
jgi:muramoyltetrapeptide carboxypeptidase